jgi:hypothetical protein
VIRVDGGVRARWVGDTDAELVGAQELYRTVSIDFIEAEGARTGPFFDLHGRVAAEDGGEDQTACAA